MKEKSAFNSLSPYRSGYGTGQSLEEENAILRTKVKKVSQLEEKVQLVLKHNSQLLVQNQKLSKLLHQQKSDYQIMKNKFEMVNSQRAGFSANQDYEIKKLINENERLKGDINELQGLKNTQLNQTRNQLHIELQNLKRQHMTNTQMYELEIRKLKDLLQRKDYQLEDNKNRINRAYNETQYEIIKLRQQKERLKNDLAIAEAEKKRESETVRNKLEVYYLTEIEAMKKNHLANLETIEFENIRLKDSLGTKNQQIQSLLIKQQKLKQNFEQTNNLLRNENESYRHKLIEFERIGEVEFENLKSKLQDLHQSEIQILKHNHQNYIACLQQEIQKLEGMVNSKNLQIEQLIKEKAQTRQINQSEQTRLKMEIESLNGKLGQLDKAFTNTTSQMNRRLQQKQQHIQYLNNLNENQNIKHNKQLESLKKLIAHKQEQLQTKASQFKQIETHLKQSVTNLHRQNQNLRDSLQKVESQRTNQQQDLKDNYQLQVNQLKEKLEGLSSKTNMSKKQSDSLKENLELKEKQSNLLKKRLQISDQNERKYNKQIEDLKTKLLNKDKQNNKIVEEQRNRLEKTFSYHLESIKGDHANNIKSEKIKISELEAQLKKKDFEYDDLLKRYKKMEEGIFELTQQQANKKELTLKYPGATAEVIATKNLFDVFIKSKVLNLSNKQN